MTGGEDGKAGASRRSSWGRGGCGLSVWKARGLLVRGANGWPCWTPGGTCVGLVGPAEYRFCGAPGAGE